MSPTAQGQQGADEQAATGDAINDTGQQDSESDSP
jgi:hypothetical protein